MERSAQALLGPMPGFNQARDRMRSQVSMQACTQKGQDWLGTMKSCSSSSSSSSSQAREQSRSASNEASTWRANAPGEPKLTPIRATKQGVCAGDLAQAPQFFLPADSAYLLPPQTHSVSTINKCTSANRHLPVPTCSPKPNPHTTLTQPPSSPLPPWDEPPRSPRSLPRPPSCRGTYLLGTFPLPRGTPPPPSPAA
eukprot:1153435-Pelagomonas_calceolata.AAC.2